MSTAKGLDGVSLADLLDMSREDLLQVVNGIFEWSQNVFTEVGSL